MVSVRVRQEPGRLERNSGDWIEFGDIYGEADRVGARVRRRGAEAIDVTVAEGVGDRRIGMHAPEASVVEKHEPHVRRQLALVRKLAHDVLAGGDHGMRNRLDRAVALRIGREIDDAVLREVDLSRLSMRAQELPGMVTPGDRHGVEAERGEALERQ